MTEVLVLVKGAMDLASQVATLAKTSKNIEIKNAVADLSFQLAELKMKICDLQNENTELQRQLLAAKSEGE